jgi:hypothetical protein
VAYHSIVLITKAVFQPKFRLFASYVRNSGTFSSNRPVRRERSRSVGREQRKDGFAEGVKQMKIAASEAVVPMLSVHKVG